jgi:hypothetical protein
VITVATLQTSAPSCAQAVMRHISRGACAVPSTHGCWTEQSATRALLRSGDQCPFHDHGVNRQRRGEAALASGLADGDVPAHHLEWWRAMSVPRGQLERCATISQLIVGHIDRE